jgi:hypothetical protein
MLQKRPVARCMSLLLAFNGCWVTGGAWLGRFPKF